MEQCTAWSKKFRPGALDPIKELLATWASTRGAAVAALTEVFSDEQLAEARAVSKVIREVDPAGNNRGLSDIGGMLAEKIRAGDDLEAQRTLDALLTPDTAPMDHLAEISAAFKRCKGVTLSSDRVLRVCEFKARVKEQVSAVVTNSVTMPGTWKGSLKDLETIMVALHEFAGVSNQGEELLRMEGGGGGVV